MAKKYKIHKRRKNDDDTVVAVSWPEPMEELITLRDVRQQIKELEIEIAHLQDQRKQLIVTKKAIKRAIAGHTDDHDNFVM